MRIYSYTAIDERGTRQQGTSESDNPALLRRELRARGWAPLAIEPVAAGAPWQRLLKNAATSSTSGHTLSRRYLQDFTYQLAILLEGGLPLEKALNLLTTQEEQPRIKTLLATLHTQLREGHAFADCLALFPKDFSMMYRTTVAAGERTGTLGAVLQYLAQYLEQQLMTRQKIQVALFYPLLLGGFSLTVTIGLLIFVIPGMAKTFEHAGHALPLLTQAVLAISAAARKYGAFLLLLLLVGVLLLRRQRENAARRHGWDRRLLRLVFIGKTIITIELNAFVNTLAMLLQSGVTLADSMTVASNVVSNSAFRKSLQAATDRVCEGGALSDAMAATGYVPLPLIGMIAGGEISGELTRVLQLSARQQSRDLQQRATWLLSVFEPCIILVTGLLVLIIVLAMMMPILSLNQLVK